MSRPPASATSRCGARAAAARTKRLTYYCSSAAQPRKLKESASAVYARAIGTPCAIDTYGVTDGGVGSRTTCSCRWQGRQTVHGCGSLRRRLVAGDNKSKPRSMSGIARTVAAKTTAISRDSVLAGTVCSGTFPASHQTEQADLPGWLRSRATLAENQPASVRTFSSSPDLNVDVRVADDAQTRGRSVVQPGRDLAVCGPSSTT